jgi:spore maturation protein CgeB
MKRFAHKVLYLGPLSGTCLDRAQALRRIGCSVDHVDPRNLLPRTPWVDRVTWHAGGHWLGGMLLKALDRRLDNMRYDLCLVDGGEWITPAIIERLRRNAPWIVNYNIDDPTGPRDGPRFAAYRQSVPHYDLVTVVRNENLAELEALGARRALRVFRSADEISHAPRFVSEHDRLTWSSEVLFLGTWFPERGPFLAELIRLGVPLTLRGPNWHKAPEWPRLRPHWAGGAISGDDYALAIQCARVNLGLLSRANRDQHTTRSLEIPALGGLLCAERTPEHQAMYREFEEALFWDGPKECAEVIDFALKDERRRSAMASAGHRRYLRDGHRNEAVMRQILETIIPAQISASEPETA